MSSINPQSVTVLLGIIATTTNALAALFFHQLPADTYNIALAFGVYSQFACGLSLVGLSGGIREHATSVAIFANYLIVDTVLYSIPRFVFMTLVAGFGDSLCNPKSVYRNGVRSVEEQLRGNRRLEEHLPGERVWSREQCHRAVSMLSMMAFVSMIGFTVVQLVLALQVRAYAARLCRENRKKREAWRKEMPVYERQML